MKKSVFIMKFMRSCLCVLCVFACVLFSACGKGTDLSADKMGAKLYAERYLKETVGSESFMKELYSYTADTMVEDYGIDRDVADAYAEVFRKTVMNVKYSVSDPVEIGDHRFAVEIRYQQVIHPSLIPPYDDQIFNALDGADMSGMDEAGMLKLTLPVLTEVMTEYCKDPQYADEQKIVVYYEKQDDGSYGFSEENQQLIGESLLYLWQ